MPASEPARVPANEINAIRIWSVKKNHLPLTGSKKGEIALNNAISPKFLYIYFYYYFTKSNTNSTIDITI